MVIFIERRFPFTRRYINERPLAGGISSSALTPDALYDVAMKLTEHEWVSAGLRSLATTVVFRPYLRYLADLLVLVECN